MFSRGVKLVALPFDSLPINLIEGAAFFARLYGCERARAFLRRESTRNAINIAPNSKREETGRLSGCGTSRKTLDFLRAFLLLAAAWKSAFR